MLDVDSRTITRQHTWRSTDYEEEEISRWWRELGEDRESKYFDHLDKCESQITPEAANQVDFVDSFMVALQHDGDDASLRKHLRELVVKTLAQWPPDYFDVCCHTDPDDPSQILVFAGDRIWGDEPYGNGYLATRMLAQTGIGTAVGIKLLEGFVTLTLTRSDEMGKHSPERNDAYPTKLVRELYRTVFSETECFEEQHIGADLAYLMGAVLEGACCEWPADRPLVQLLRECLPPANPVWNHVRVDTGNREKAKPNV